MDQVYDDRLRGVAGAGRGDSLLPAYAHARGIARGSPDGVTALIPLSGNSMIVAALTILLTDPHAVAVRANWALETSLGLHLIG